MFNSQSFGWPLVTMACCSRILPLNLALEGSNDEWTLVRITKSRRCKNENEIRCVQCTEAPKEFHFLHYRSRFHKV
jgi:hypothetical protein